MDNNGEGNLSNNVDNPTKELECGISINNNSDEYEVDGNNSVKDFGDTSKADVAANGDGIPEIAINGLNDMGDINFKKLSAIDIMKYNFADVGVAFTFYHWYARLNGFSARKSKVRRNKDEQIIQQIFVCYRQGFREDRFGNNKSRQREPKKNTRCGCEAKCHVHIDYHSGRWYTTHFNDVHNHLLVEEEFIGLLPSHRTMADDDIMQMNNFRKVGMRTPQIFGTFASQFSGFEHVGFLKQDMYNEVDNERRSKGWDAKGVLAYLCDLKSGDAAMYWKHTVDNEGRLEHLFWCDGRSRSDYSVFGNVLAFDATYKRNKYMCPLVVFSGVNHHNQTIIFGSAIVANETEETYVWLLEQFADAMRGKMPVSVITNGDLAMRNAIRRVLLAAHHRLCAWHLIRNATTNIKNPRFTSIFKRCMLGDFEIRDFEKKWDDMVSECGVEENNWVLDMYAKKEMWATAHIRVKFFAGFRTTSSCEGLHAQVGKFVDSRNNLMEFLQHFKLYLEYFRFKEVEADFASLHGEQVLQTPLQSLERYASKLYTKEIFLIFRSILLKACTVRVIDWKETATSRIYFVTKHRGSNSEWRVTFSPLSMALKCSYLKMESLGIPCEHVVSVMCFEDIVELPQCLVLERWTENAKDLITCETQ